VLLSQQLGEEALRHAQPQRHYTRQLVSQLDERVKVSGGDGTEVRELLNWWEAVEAVQVGVEGRVIRLRPVSARVYVEPLFPVSPLLRQLVIVPSHRVIR